MVATRYIWNELTDNIAVEKDSQGNISQYSQRPELYGRVLSQDRNGTRTYYHYDDQASVRQLTDSTGTVTDTSTYTAFGEGVARTGSTVSPWGYKGALGYSDSSANQNLYVRARHLSPILGAWLSVDPLFLGPDRGSPYNYAENNPLSGADPSGLMKCQNPLKQGVTYVPGRGTWSAAGFSFPSTPAYGDPSVSPIPSIKSQLTNGWIEPMYMVASWTPTAGAFTDVFGCCCCDEIGWSQIIKSKGEYYGLFGPVSESRDNHNWKLDGGLQYPGASVPWTSIPRSTDPCARNPSNIGFFDMPGRPIDPLGYGYWVGNSFLRYWRFQLELCVVCLSGIEGPRIGVINDPAIMARWYELIAYDCVYYGWTVRWDSTKGKHVVTYDNVVTGAPWDGPWVMAAGLGAQFGGGP